MADRPAESGRPSADSIGELGAIDVETLLDQAAQLTREAAVAVGTTSVTQSRATESGRADVVVGPRASRPSHDLSEPLNTLRAVDGTAALVAQQLADVQSLVSQANAESGALALSDMAAINDLVGQALRATRVLPPRRKPAVVAAPGPTAPEQTTDADVGRADSAAASAPGARDDALAAESVDPSAPKEQHGTADLPGQMAKPESAIPSHAADAPATAAATAPPDAIATPRRTLVGRMMNMVVSPVRGVVWLLNKPFDGLADDYRTIAGMVGIVTAVAAAVLWVLPLVMR